MLQQTVESRSGDQRLRDVNTGSGWSHMAHVSSIGQRDTRAAIEAPDHSFCERETDVHESEDLLYFWTFLLSSCDLHLPPDLVLTLCSLSS